MAILGNEPADVLAKRAADLDGHENRMSGGYQAVGKAEEEGKRGGGRLVRRWLSGGRWDGRERIVAGSMMRAGLSERK